MAKSDPLHVISTRKELDGKEYRMAVLEKSDGRAYLWRHQWTSLGWKLVSWIVLSRDEVFTLRGILASWPKVDPLHPTGRCTCYGEGTCEWCVSRGSV